MSYGCRYPGRDMNRDRRGYESQVLSLRHLLGDIDVARRIILVLNRNIMSLCGLNSRCSGQGPPMGFWEHDSAVV